MSHFNSLPEFEKDFKRLSGKYLSLNQDFKDLEDVLNIFPTGRGKNFTIIHCSDDLKIVKVGLACKSLRKRSMRVIYAYHDSTVTFIYLELYFKGDKANEDRGRIERYLKGFKKKMEEKLK